MTNGLGLKPCCRAVKAILGQRHETIVCVVVKFYWTVEMRRFQVFERLFSNATGD